MREATEHLSSGNDMQKQAKVLLIDDDPELLRGLNLSLRHEGYEITMLPSGSNALEVIGHIQPDVVVLDVMMPGVDGWEVLRSIRSDPTTPDLPVLLLTAKDSEESKVLGFSLGADDYLTKPFSVRELRCRVAALLRRTRPEGESRTSERIPVVSGSSGYEFLDSRDIHWVEGIRNYSYLHTRDGRFLSRLSLGEVEHRVPEEFMRVHRSYIVNLDHVRGCRWATRSSYRLTLANADSTEVPVSRTLVSEVQQRLKLR